jgi:hypothetical protein
MAIGLGLGRDAPTDSVDPCYQAVHAFLDGFYDQFQSISCLELTGVNLSTPEGQAGFREKWQIKNCTNYVGETARLVVEILGHQV